MIRRMRIVVLSLLVFSMTLFPKITETRSQSGSSGSSGVLDTLSETYVRNMEDQQEKHFLQKKKVESIEGNQKNQKQLDKTPTEASGPSEGGKIITKEEINP